MMNISLSDVPKRFKAMCALVLLHGCLIVIYNLIPTLQGLGLYADQMLLMLLVAVISLLIGYLVLTRRLLIILGVSMLSAYLLSLSLGQFTNSWPPIDPLVWFANPNHLLVNAIYVLEAIIPLFGIVILFLGIKTSFHASRA